LYVKAQLKLDGINSVMRENILGVRLVKIFGLQEKLFKKYSNENNAYRDLNIKSGVLMAPITSVVYLILNSGTAIILLIAGMLFVNSDNHPSISGGIFAFTQIITILLFASLILVAVIINHVRTVASIKRINEVFETNSSLIETKKPLPLNLKNNSVEFRNVSFKYYGNQKDAISNINFFIPTGKTLGIIGETGSGKTTIASLLSRFYDVNKGSVKIGGIDVRDLKLEQLRDKVCVVLQEPVLFSGTILSNLKYGNNNANNKKIKNAAMDACAW
jgi:ATP-binding cassette subfamily B protein